MLNFSLFKTEESDHRENRDELRKNHLLLNPLLFLLLRRQKKAS